MIPYVVGMAASALICLQPATPSAVSLLAQGIGLSDQAMAAAGVPPSQVGTLVAALRSSPLAEQFVLLQSQIRTEESRLAQASLAETTGGENDAALIEGAVSLIEQLRAQRALVVNAARQLVRDQVGAAQADALEKWWSAPPFLPAELRVRAWSADELKQLRLALVAERSGLVQEAGPTDGANLLASARAESSVVAAKAALETATPVLAAALADALAATVN